MKDTTRDIVENREPDELVDQMAADLMEINAKALAMKKHYVELKRAKDLAGINRFIERASTVDLPDLLAKLAAVTTGSIVITAGMAEYAIEGSNDAIEYAAGGDDESEEPVLSPEVIESVREELGHTIAVCNYLESQENLPDDVSAALDHFKTKVEQGTAQLEEWESALESQDQDNENPGEDGRQDQDDDQQDRDDVTQDVEERSESDGAAEDSTGEQHAEEEEPAE